MSEGASHAERARPEGELSPPHAHEMQAPQANGREAPNAGRFGRLTWLVPLAGVLLAGAALRLVAADDMEYKADEKWTFDQTQPSSDRSFPWLGMPSSAGMDNPGMSVWVFMALGKLLGVDDPVSLARAVQWLNVAAILLQVAFAWRCVPWPDREFWLWSAAFLCVNPLAVLFHRKIWPPSVLPIFIVALLIAWWFRQRPWAAFAWGLVGAAIGQIHMSGFHFAAAAVLWTWWFGDKRTAWKSWTAGSVLGVLPMIPWLKYLIATHGSRPSANVKWEHLFEAKFWLRWFSEPFGWGADYALGDDFRDFLSQPIVAGQATWLVGLLHVAAIASAVGLLVRIYRQRGTLFGAAARVQVRLPTVMAQDFALWGYGILLTLTLTPIHCHYMLIAYPMEFLWLARMALGAQPDRSRRAMIGRALLAGMCLVQLLISASFLGYIHVKQRIDGDYGVVYRAQVERQPLR
ncbi:MAG TPA: hypothetical protein VMV10_07075 [Pirellulales bacterium]|nr:hypothetical protein [Pirellulales bacterium]